MDNRLYLMLSKLNNSFTVHIKKELRGAGLKVSPGQLGILFLLKMKDSRTMSDLSMALETDNSAITRTVDRLEKSGFVRRQINENDRREFHILITGPGIEETKKARDVIDSVNRKIGTGFSEKELSVFKDIVVRMNSMFRL